MGTWYVYASYDYPDILGLDCISAFYRLTPDGNAMNNQGGKNLSTNAWVFFVLILTLIPNFKNDFIFIIRRRTSQSTFVFDKPGIGYYTYKAGKYCFFM